MGTSSGLATKKRLIWLLSGITFLFFMLVLRLGYIQLVQAQELTEKARRQWTSDLNVEAKRGRILDRAGNVLAQNASAEALLAHPASVTAPELVAEKLEELLGLDRETVYSRVTNRKQSEVILKRQLTREQAQAVRELKLEGLVLAEDTKRYYPRSNFLAQVIGFVSIDGAGQAGLELQYDSFLRGKNGRVVAEQDAAQREVPGSVEQYIPAEDGLDLVLTIDLVIQNFAEQAADNAMADFSPKSVQIIVMEPDTGAILAAVNKPDFDLNNPPRSDIAQLQSLSRNRVMTDSYEPGSTYKIITTAAALEEGVTNPTDGFYDPGYIMVDGQKIKCWRSYNPHGSETLTEAVKNSCNPVFVQLALRMGRDTFYEYIYDFGFGRTSGVDFPGESKGIVQPVKYIKNVDIARVAFGQSIAVTPLQLVAGVSAAVNGGNLMQPYLVQEIRTPEGAAVQQMQPTLRRSVISEGTSQSMREILEYTVANGVKNAQIEGYRVGGKTGTAQKYENGRIVSNKHISSFVGFAPADDPKIVVLVMVDEPNISEGFGSVVAAPYARQIMENTLKYLKIQPSVEVIPAEQAEVPDVVGMDFDAARQALLLAGFDCLTDGEGPVQTQMPAAGSMEQKGQQVLLQGRANSEEGSNTRVQVPDLSGMTVLEANAHLTTLGLRMNVEGRGICYAQDPVAGTWADVDETVTIQCAQPSEQETAPPQ